MTTTTELKAFAKSHGLKIEENYPQSYSRYALSNGTRNQWNAETNYKYQIGIELNPMIWYWWETYVHETPDQIEQDTLLFAERYSQRSGQSAKGWYTGWKAELKIRGLE